LDLRSAVQKLAGRELGLHDLAPLRRWCPHRPNPKQGLFLRLRCLEAFYGGAAGGGKSEALLMAALMYVHLPGYAALILRRDTQRLRLAGGLIPRSHEWLAGKARWNDEEQQWTFATGKRPATLRFGYLQTPLDRHRYQSSEFQFIGFDELTEFEEEDYLYLFSRLRRLQFSRAPLRIRSASNPGNLGHAWVKRRFIGTETDNDRVYIPARIADNPALDIESYRLSLSHLPPITREQLLNGDWSVRADGLIRPHWIREYSLVQGQYELHRGDGGAVGAFAEAACRRFITIDPAGTSADRAREVRGREPSWSVAQVWDQPRGALSQHLLLRHQWRGRVGFDALCHQLRALYAQWRPQRMHIENEKLGLAAVDVLARELPIEPIATGGSDKIARAAPLLVKLEAGEIWLPRGALPFRQELEAEWFAWTGHPDEPCDQIDAAAYAAQLASRGGVIRM
jgi:phage terminase large subunit-like protein